MKQDGQSGYTMALAPAAVAVGGTTRNYAHGAVTYTIDGRFYNLAAAADGAMPTVSGAQYAANVAGAMGSSNGQRAFDELRASDRCMFVLAVDKDGTVACFQGQKMNQVARAEVDDSVQYPLIPKTHCPLGAIVVVADATYAGSWVCGTDSLTTVAGVTATFHDLQGIPSEPYRA